MDGTDLNSTRLQHSDLATAEQRIAAWATWSDLTAPTLEHEDGSILRTNELYDWIRTSHASFDWLFFGEDRHAACT